MFWPEHQQKFELRSASLLPPQTSLRRRRSGGGASEGGGAAPPGRAPRPAPPLPLPLSLCASARDSQRAARSIASSDAGGVPGGG